MGKIETFALVVGCAGCLVGCHIFALVTMEAMRKGEFFASDRRSMSMIGAGASFVGAVFLLGSIASVITILSGWFL